jgi:hypothetical protein
MAPQGYSADFAPQVENLNTGVAAELRTAQRAGRHPEELPLPHPVRS